MQIKTKGLIIKHRDIGENDKVVTVFTDTLGVVEMIARNSKRGAMGSASQLLVYGEFNLYKSKNNYIINSVDIIESFYNIRLDVKHLYLATYFAQILFEVCKGQDTYTVETLNLTLNSLSLLNNNKIDSRLLKFIFELKIMSVCGYMPDLICCFDCHKYDEGTYYFDILKGIIYCEDCHSKNECAYKISYEILLTLRHIIYSDDRKIFSFSVGDNMIEMISFLCENYVLIHTDKVYSSLDVYKTL